MWIVWCELEVGVWCACLWNEGGEGRFFGGWLRDCVKWDDFRDGRGGVSGG